MSTAPPIATDRAYDELKRLFYLYRLSNLNVRYYGKRAEHFERLAWWVDVVAGAASAAALGALLLFDKPPYNEAARNFAAGLAGFAAFVTAMTPLLGWQRRARQYYNLHFAYEQLFGQIEAVMAEIRRNGDVSEENVGKSKLLHDQFMRLDALDELDPDEELINRLDAKVRKAYPEDYIWNAL